MNKSKIRLLMLAPSTDLGGSEKSFVFLASQIKENGRFELSVGAPKGYYSSALKNICKNNFTIVRFETLPHTDSLMSILRLPWYILALISNLLIIMLNIIYDQSDAVFINNSTMLSANIAAFLLRKKVITYVREDYYYGEKNIKHKLFWLLSAMSTTLICSNKAIKNTLIKYKSPSKVEMLYDGAYSLSSKTIKSVMRRNTEEFRIGMIGTIYPLKGQDIFIKSIAELKRNMLRVKGVIYGRSRRPYYLNKIKKLISDLGVNDNVIINGEEFDLTKVYNSIDALAIASWNEGFSMVFAEALKMNIPVISTPVGIMADLGEEGKNILFFNPGDYWGLAEKVKKLVKSIELRKLLIENGSKLYDRYFENAKIAKRFKEIIETNSI